MSFLLLWHPRVVNADPLEVPCGQASSESLHRHSREAMVRYTTESLERKLNEGLRRYIQEETC